MSTPSSHVQHPEETSVARLEGRKKDHFFQSDTRHPSCLRAPTSQKVLRNLDVQMLGRLQAQDGSRVRDATDTPPDHKRKYYAFG